MLCCENGRNRSTITPTPQTYIPSDSFTHSVKVESQPFYRTHYTQNVFKVCHRLKNLKIGPYRIMPSCIEYVTPSPTFSLFTENSDKFVRSIFEIWRASFYDKYKYNTYMPLCEKLVQSCQ